MEQSGFHADRVTSWSRLELSRLRCITDRKEVGAGSSLPLKNTASYIIDFSARMFQSVLNYMRYKRYHTGLLVIISLWTDPSLFVTISIYYVLESRRVTFISVKWLFGNFMIAVIYTRAFWNWFEGRTLRYETFRTIIARSIVFHFDFSTCRSENDRWIHPTYGSRHRHVGVYRVHTWKHFFPAASRNVVSINDKNVSNNTTPFLYYSHQSFDINIKFAKKLASTATRGGVEIAPSACGTKNTRESSWPISSIEEGCVDLGGFCTIRNQLLRLLSDKKGLRAVAMYKRWKLYSSTRFSLITFAR